MTIFDFSDAIRTVFPEMQGKSNVECANAWNQARKAMKMDKKVVLVMEGSKKCQ